MGGGLINEDGKGHTTPPRRGGRGRGRGNFPNDTRRPTLVHIALQEFIDANRLNASLKGTQESHRNMMVQHCLQSWEASEMTIGHGPTPTAEDLTEENGKGTSEQQETIPHAPKQQTPKTTAARQLLMDNTQKEKDTAKESDTAECNWIRGLESNLRENSNGPTALTLGRTAPTSTYQAVANVNPLPIPIPLRHLKGTQKETLQDPNTSPRAVGAEAKQDSPKPKQGRDAGRDKERKKHITTTPMGPTLSVPTPEDRQGKSHN